MADLKFLLGKIRHLSKGLKARPSKGYSLIRDLFSFLLHLTVVKEGQVVKLTEVYPNTVVLGGPKDELDPLLLNDRRYLRLSVGLYENKQNHSLSVRKASYQYQVDHEDNARWIFRYDYIRNPSDQYPPSHLQLNAELPAEIRMHRDLPKIHFPTGRMSLEAIIRFLIEDFHVPSNHPSKIWRPVLAESERLFHEVAHLPLSGPAK